MATIQTVHLLRYCLDNIVMSNWANTA